MIIDQPTETAGLRQLWKEAFGDTDAFLDIFFARGYDPKRCRCIREQGKVVAALYWFDCSLDGRKIAYLYAVATAKSHRGQGLCHRLMADTHALLRAEGYAGAILVPGEGGLFRFYAAMGYQTIPCIRQGQYTPSDPCTAVTRLSVDAYAELRRQLLPKNAVVQEGENLSFLSEIATLYGGSGWVMAASTQGEDLTAMEFLGDTAEIPGILAALGKKSGSFRTPGNDPFAMYLPFDGGTAPAYFGLAFD